MKLVLKGHDERYVVEQGMLNLFPGERPVYEPIGPEDDTWARVSLREEADGCTVEVERERQYNPFLREAMGQRS